MDMEPASRTRLRTWGSLVLLWSLPGFLQFVQEFSYTRIYRSTGTSFASTAWLFLPAWYPWILLTPVVVHLTRRLHPTKVGWTLSTLGHAIGMLVVGLAHLLLLGIYQLSFTGHPWTKSSLLPWLQRVLWSLQPQAEVLAYGVVLALTLAIDARKQAEERRLASTRMETRLTRARLDALKGQLRPHFLFNALNSVQVMMDGNKEQASQMLLGISSLLRSSLEAQADEMVPLDEELRMLELYLGVEAVRFSDRLRFSITASPDAREALVPSWILQPLVENALRHGIAPSLDGGQIQVLAERRAERLWVEISDDGAGLEISPREGIGIGNTQERLRELYGDEQSLSVEPSDPRGTRATLELPYDRNQKGRASRHA